MKVRVGRSFSSRLERQIIPETDIPAAKSCRQPKGMKCVPYITEVSSTTALPSYTSAVSHSSTGPGM